MNLPTVLIEAVEELEGDGYLFWNSGQIRRDYNDIEKIGH